MPPLAVGDLTARMIKDALVKERLMTEWHDASHRRVLCDVHSNRTEYGP